jgi:hypothetical protein
MREQLDSLTHAALLDPRTPAETRASLHLWAASESYAKAGGDEFAFADAALRLYVGAFAKLDIRSARDYLAALLDRADPTSSAGEKLQAEERRSQAWSGLRAALALAGRPTKGRG